MPTGIALENGKLRQNQIDQYWADGYLFPMEVASSAQTALWRTELEEIEAKWLDNGLPLPLNTYKRVNPQIVMPLAHKIGMHAPILDVVEGVLGPEVMLYSVEFLTKEPHTKHVVTMHQDLAYWGMGDMDNILTAWLALSDATPASGCMDFVRASHKNPILPHEDSFDENNLLSRGQEVQVNVPDADKIAVELPAGQLSLHHGLTVHGSGPNASDDRRIGVAIRYISAKMGKSGGVADFALPARGDCANSHFTHLDAPVELFGKKEMALFDHVRTEQTKVMMAGAKGGSKIY